MSVKKEGRTLDKHLKRLLVFTLVIMTWVSSAVEVFSETLVPDYDSIKTDLKKIVTKEMKKYKVCGVSIAIIDGEAVWTQSFGYCDQKQKILFSADSTVPIGEITVLFTNMAIMQLAEEGKIDIDQPLQTYIPEFSIKSRFSNASPITIRSILADCSGLPENYLKNSIGLATPYFTSLVDDIKDEYVAFPPGYFHLHSVIGTSLLGVLIERVSGEKYCDYIVNNILKPLEMNNSSFTNIFFKETFSQFYIGKKPFYVNPFQRDIPEYGLCSSINDLSHFVKMILAKGKYKKQVLLKNETFETVFGNQNENIPSLIKDYQFGFGWVLNFDPWIRKVGRTISRGSGILLGNSIILILPDYQLGVVVVTNTLQEGIISLVNETAKLALEKKAGIKTEGLEISPPPPITPLIPENVCDYEGSYITTGAGLVTIKLSGNKLILSSPAESYQLVPRSDNTFTLGSRFFGRISAFSNLVREIRVSFNRIADRRVICLNGYGEQLIFGVAVDVVPISENWQSRCGKYLLFDEENLAKVEGEVKVIRGFLALKIKTGKNVSVVIIKPINENEAIIQGLGLYAQETVQWSTAEDGKVIFFFEGWKFKKVK
jgi:CubicO group peptidase (beta-lactamase class C family)